MKILNMGHSWISESSAFPNFHVTLRRFKCIYSDINVHAQRYLSRRLPLRSFMIASMRATDLFKNKDIHDIIIYIQVYKCTIEHF